MTDRKWLAAGVVAGSLGVGALIGAATFAPQLGFAQTSQTGSGTGASSTEAVAEGWCVGDGEGSISAAADAIGIPPGDLLYAMRDGSTIADVATSEGVDVQAVVDAIVASMQDRLDAAVADGFISQELADQLAGGLEERATAIVNGEGPFMHGGAFGMPGGPFMHGGFMDGGSSMHGSWGPGWNEGSAETGTTSVGL